MTKINGSGERTGFIDKDKIGFVLLLVVVILFFIYAILPAIQEGSTTDDSATPQNGSIDVNVELPRGEAPSIPVPAPEGPAIN